VLSRRVVRFTYTDARGRTSRGHLACFAMVLYRHGLYIVGKRLQRPEDGLAIPAGTACDPPFAVERFVDAEALRRTSFAPPSDFKLSTVIHAAGGIFLAPVRLHEVMVEFSKAKATYVRAREWYRDQRIDELPDGRVRLAFSCPNLTPIVSWVLEWGPHARAVGPPELVERVVAELDAARAQYPG
jgi:predicted DNA-binding transcriptional regulator YafY